MIKKSELQHNILNPLTIIQLANDLKHKDPKISESIERIVEYIKGLEDEESN